jgi:HEAT repeat protein
MEKDSTIKPANPELSEFVLSLIQAFLKTGYYMPSHPEAQKATTGLYEAFKEIIKGKRELSFFTATENRQQEVFMVGIADEPLSISSLMLKSMAELFVPKFAEYFERKHLSAFSLKANISSHEFEKFIAIMTESPYTEEKETDVRERLTLDLIKNSILAVSTVFNVDLVGKGRKLSWRIKISLSRLKKDLNMIPLYNNIPEEKMNEIRKMIFEDIIRPLRNPTLIKELLINLDLVSNELQGIEADEFERKIIEQLNEKTLPSVVTELIAHILELKKAFESQQEVDILVTMDYQKKLIRKVLQRLSALDHPDDGLLSEAIEAGIISIEDLPSAARDRILKKLSLSRFLESPGLFYQEINNSVSPEEIKDKLQSLAEFLPVLFSLGRYKEILEIAMFYEGKSVTFEIDDNRDLLEAIAQEVAAKAAGANKEEQTKLLSVMSSIDRLGDYLLADLLDCPSRSVRRMVLKLLSDRGPVIVPFVLSALKKKEGWHYLRNALTALSNAGVGNPEVVEVIRQNLGHPEPNVRKEAVLGTVALMREKGEGLLVPMLVDKDIDVRKRVLSALASMSSIHPAFIDFMSNTLKNRVEDEAPLLEQVLNIIPDIALPPEKREAFEDSLITILKESSGFSTFIRRAQPGVQVKSGVIKALGSVGTSKSLRILQKHTSDKNQTISRAAIEAVQNISKEV